MTKSLVLLDAGNTLLLLDPVVIAGAIGEQGWKLDPADIARAEARARSRVSRFIHEGRSTEAEDVRQYYARTILESLEQSPPDGLDVPDLVGRLGGLGTSPDGADRLWGRVSPGTNEALDRLLAAGWRLGVVSNSDGFIQRRLAAAGLLQRFETVVDSALVGVEKPDPKIWQIALDRLEVGAESAIYVGDIYHVDVLGARAVGLEAILVDPYDDQPEAECPRIRSVADLPEFLGDPS